MSQFEPINKAYNTVFRPGELNIGIVSPIERYTQSPVPSLERHLERVKLAEAAGFAAIWVRDVPFNVPSFGDAGQTFDPFTYLGYLAAHTEHIALATGSIALPLHYPVHVAKSAATIDQLSGGRLILGVASGDRPEEYPAMQMNFEQRDQAFREAFEYIRAAAGSFPHHQSELYGHMNGQIDVLPKPTGHKLPILITGHSRQTIDWIAEHGDGWMYYPRNLYMQQYNIQEFKQKAQATGDYDKPFMQPLYLDLMADDDFIPQPIHLGFRMGAHHAIEYFEQLRSLGVNHIGLNLRFSSSPIDKAIERIAEKILPHFNIKTENAIS